MIGTVLKDTYRVIQPLGEGGMGAIYVAEHKKLPRRYAVKVLKSASSANAELMTRFEREARIASSLGHPNIVEVLDFDVQPDGAPFLVMELLDGEDLARRIAKRKRLDPVDLLPLARQLCAALGAAHDADIVHRDLKPQNVFLHRWGGEEVVKVLDFGISKITGGQTGLTEDSTIIGTAFYMAPEQARGSGSEVDGRADLFSLGAILFECLTGKRAFDGDSMPAIVHALCYGDRPSLADHRPDLAEALDPVLQRLYAVEREDRYATAQQAWDALAPALGGEASTLPAGKPSLATGMELDATVASQPTPEFDATVASDRITGHASGRSTAAESPHARPEGDPGAQTGDTLPPAAAATADPSQRSGSSLPKVLLGALLGAALIVGGYFAVRAALDPGGGGARKSPPTQPDPRARPRPTQHVTLALLPGRCAGKDVDVSEVLRESRLKEIKHLLIPPDEVDRALGALSKEGGSRDGRERRVGQRLGAMLLVTTRCAGKQVKVKLVRVADNHVLTKLVDQPMTEAQRKDLVSLISFERVKLVADVETKVKAASRAYKRYVKLRQGGVHQGNYQQVLESLEAAHKADPSWDRPRFILANMLSSQFHRTGDDKLLPRVRKLVLPMSKPNHKYEGLALAMLGVVDFYRGDVAAASKWLNRAAALEPNHAGVHRARSEIYMLQGELRLAQAAMARAIAIDPKDSYSSVRLASNYWKAGEFSKALQAVQTYVATQDRQHRLGAQDPDLRLGYPRAEGGHALRGMLLLFQGQLAPAEKELQRELEQLKSRSSLSNALMEAYTYYGLALVRRLQGKMDRAARARKRAERALRRHLKNNANPNLELSELMWILGPMAPDWLGPLLASLERPQKPFYAYVLMARAAAHWRLAQPDKAKALVDKALTTKHAQHGGIRKVRRRFRSMCRQIDANWKKHGKNPFRLPK